MNCLTDLQLFFIISGAVLIAAIISQAVLNAIKSKHRSKGISDKGYPPAHCPHIWTSDITSPFKYDNNE